MRALFIEIHPEAPNKPSEGSPCNGCGVCCLTETCPIARISFRQSHGPCPALLWSTDEKRYFCGLLSRTHAYLPWLPDVLQKPVRKILRRWIAAGQGCDCTAEFPNEA